jgi:hypothetical protein
VRVNYDDLSEAEQQELQQLVGRFLSGQVELEALPIDSIKHIRDTYKAFKAIAAAGGFSVGGAGDAAAAAHSRHATRVSDTRSWVCVVLPSQPRLRVRLPAAAAAAWAASKLLAACKLYR